MLKRLLIANRGEIARRIIRTADRMGVETVAVYSDADARAPHVREGTVAVRIGPPPARESYLDMDAVLAAARDSGADSIHPGYGFLSENADFAERVIASGLTWVGPPPSAIRAMGLKDAAKRLMTQAGVPVTPGYLGEDQSPERLAREAAAIGYPVLIKAVAGGGGKGMRRVDDPADFAAALSGAQREGAASFGDDRVLIERYATRPRHIEVQVFADSHGNVVHLFERDCSLQRRHQKVIEEAPAPGMDDATRAAITAAAIKAARAVDYVGAGTVEFIADASEGLRADRIWFMEMNTRLQVEHPVTEMVTGLDLVEWQLRVAAGERLPLAQDEIRLSGWAMEARLYAENPATGFLPSTGKLDHFQLPEPGDGVRVDTGVEQGGEVTPFYDPMIAKLISHADTREGAAEKLAGACKAVEVWPVKTNAGFLARCLEQPEFIAGEVDTGFIERRPDRLAAAADELPASVQAQAMALLAEEAHYGPHFGRAAPWNSDVDDIFGFRLNADPRAMVATTLNGMGARGSVRSSRADHRSWCVSGNFDEIEITYPSISYVQLDGDQFVLFSEGQAYLLSPPDHDRSVDAASSGQLSAPMPGRIVSVSAQVGDEVKRGAPVVALEAMKMEHALTAPFDARVAEVTVAVGDQVVEGAVLARLEAL